MSEKWGLIVTIEETIPVVLSLCAYTFILSRYLRKEVIACCWLSIQSRNCNYQQGNNCIYTNGEAQSSYYLLLKLSVVILMVLIHFRQCVVYVLLIIVQFCLGTNIIYQDLYMHALSNFCIQP